MGRSELTSRQVEAATLVAADELTDEQIAEQIGVARSTLNRWKDLPAFQERVAVVSQELENETLRYAIAKRRNRMKAVNDRWLRMQRIIEERAADEHTGVYGSVFTEDGKEQPLIAPGWHTGLLVRTEKQIGAGASASRVIEFAVDTGLLKEMREHEKQAAQEAGQWSDKTEITVTMRRKAERIAQELGLNVEDVLAEAQEILQAMQ